MATPQNVLDSLDVMNAKFALYGPKTTAVTDAQTALTAAQATLTSAQTICMGANMAKMTALTEYSAATMQLSMLQQNGTQEQIAAQQAIVNDKHAIYDSKANDYLNAFGAQVVSQNAVSDRQTDLANAQMAAQTARTNSNAALDALVISCNQTWRLF